MITLAIILLLIVSRTFRRLVSTTVKWTFGLLCILCFVTTTADRRKY